MCKYCHMKMSVYVSCGLALGCRSRMKMSPMKPPLSVGYFPMTFGRAPLSVTAPTSFQDNLAYGIS